MTSPHSTQGSIAIVGMAGRFPGANSIDGLWSMLLQGTEAVRRFTPEELAAAGVPARESSDPDYRPFAANVAGIEQFDAAFFGIPPAEARLMDPQHRFFLECVWEALEDASTPPASCQGRIGVFGTSSLSSYLLHHILPSAEHRGQAFSYPVMLGNDKDFLATRVSYRLGLTGPSLTVQAGCSSSLVAVDLAKTALLSDQCEVAVAGGVSLFTPQTTGYLYQQGGTFSADGHCRPFDAQASGMIRGSGCAVVVLKRLEQALSDRDHIYAVIAGTAVNNDGSLKAGYTAPSVPGQVEVVKAALASSGLPASAIGYIEAHGTGTYLGDPIEVAALNEAYSQSAGPAASCALGSIKANIGHLDAAAGVTGLVKAALVLHHQTIPPQINFTQPNPELRLEETPFTIHTRTHQPSAPLHAAAVTSLGIGGTNVHCVLTSPPPTEPRTGQPAGSPYSLLLSAPEGKRLADTAADLADHLQQHPQTRLDDLAYTLANGRQPLAHRAVVTATTLPQAVARLEELRACLTKESVPQTSHHQAQQGDMTAARKIRIPGVHLHRERHWIEAVAAVQSGDLPSPHPLRRTLDLATTIAETFCEHLGIDMAGPDDDYQSLGGDSLMAVALVDKLRRRLDVPLSLQLFYRLRTPRRLAAWATSQSAPAQIDRADSLQLVRDGTPGREVFLIHPSGGTTQFAHALAVHSVTPDPLYAIAYPSDHPTPPTSIEGMAEHYIALIRTVAPCGPYRIGGYSLGGTVALAMARILQHEGEEVENVVLFDTLPPHAHRRNFSDQEFLASFPALLASTLGLVQPRLADGPPRTVEEAIEAVRQPNWTSDTMQQLRTLYHAWHTSAQALSSHDPHPYGGKVHLLAATQPLPLSHSVLLTDAVTTDDWQPYLTGDLRLSRVPGDHFTMFDQEHIPMLAAAFDRALQEEQSGGAVEQGTRHHRIPSPMSTSPVRSAGLTDESRRTAWVFAGQGTQHRGMGRDLLTSYPEMIREADAILGYSVADLCAGNPQRPLSSTLYAQPAIYVVNALAARRRHEEAGAPDLVLGHSLGEYNALEVAGSLSFGDGLRLVVARADAMSRIEGGGMLAVNGIPQEAMQSLLATAEFRHLDLASINTEASLTLAGPHSELQRLTPVLLEHGARAVRGLEVSGAFHSRYMRPAVDALRHALHTVTFKEPTMPVLSSVTGEPLNQAEIPTVLAKQLESTVCWRQCVERAITDFDPDFLEIGTRKILTSMNAHIQAGFQSRC
ncbi:beta-ketoacyl synthase N-terminal-like domain-containing protein [Streptomyces sp. NPDC051909]|uniref:beta-ketoacyl synthase N-terminal-like domain-containing protein n=1 Tax=Streptomyces sp. NPDC051909 TaxID=3154944 RepID=UPI003442374B